MRWAIGRGHTEFAHADLEAMDEYLQALRAQKFWESAPAPKEQPT
jgi:hypothetical protein